jgi:hypothetical protein
MKRAGLYLLAICAVGCSVTGTAQKNSQFIKVKPSSPAKVKQSAPWSVGKPPAPPSTTNAKDLQTTEHQALAKPHTTTAKPSSSAKTQAAVKKPAPALKPAVKDKPNAAIAFNGNASDKTSGLVKKGQDPFKARLKTPN